MLAWQHSCMETMRCWTNKRHLTSMRMQTTAATMAPVSFRNVDPVPSKHSNHFHQDHRVPRFGRLSKQSFSSSHFLTPTTGRHNLVTSKPRPWIDDRHLPILEQKNASSTTPVSDVSLVKQDRSAQVVGVMCPHHLVVDAPYLWSKPPVLNTSGNGFLAGRRPGAKQTVPRAFQVASSQFESGIPHGSPVTFAGCCLKRYDSYRIVDDSSSSAHTKLPVLGDSLYKILL
ncbi:hypothetical protein LY76DRAFT_247981 [Colletotrichum caudatum]|nr:hypothetical protein LY76DRAFT_247981 [Colletotrichum caudatum]